MADWHQSMNEALGEQDWLQDPQLLDWAPSLASGPPVKPFSPILNWGGAYVDWQLGSNPHEVPGPLGMQQTWSDPSWYGNISNVALAQENEEHHLHPHTHAHHILVNSEAHESHDTIGEPSLHFGKPIINRWIYLRTACAACDAPLDTFEQRLELENPELFCTRNQTSDHLALICDHQGCGKRFAAFKHLQKHSIEDGHLTLSCALPECSQPLQFTEIELHFQNTHGPDRYCCSTCGAGFSTQSRLDCHGEDVGHAPYICQYPECGSVSSRFRDLIRHQRGHKRDVPRHPCPHCRNYRGSNAFKRKDHLRQHMEGYHQIELPKTQIEPIWVLYSCHKKGCRVWCHDLENLTTHMLSKHGSSAYVCKERSCLRIGMNGFATDKELKAHVKNDHIPPFQCTQQGCPRVGNKGWRRKIDMMKHLKKVHSITQ